jgi:type IV pilus assembly protein PilY1
MVYVGANDGMLHAFRAADDTTTALINEGGQEDWAYIPLLVMPNLYHLADKHYGDNHRFYVDGSPVAADICVSFCTNAASAVWKTILIGGLNHGGRGYYALDVTDPANPKALWEFTDNNMGYTYGNPKVVKLSDGTWVVLVTSGYNNVPPYAPSGDGHGRLYVLDAYTGNLIRTIDTGVGSVASPSGLARIDAPVTTPGIDATAIAVYGGDLEGNLWRFDINDELGDTGYDAQLLATLLDASSNVQPITAKPLITVVSGNIVVNIGTGRYLGATDQNSATHDSFYAIKDTFPTTSVSSTAIYDNPRTYSGALGPFVQQTQTSISCPVGTPTSVCATGEAVYVSSNHPVNFNTNSGWYVDFPQTGERDNTDPAIIKGTLVIATNVPSANSCSIGGDSFLYQLDYRTGGAVSTAPNGIVGTLLGHELTSRPVVAMLQDGTTRTYTQGSGGQDPQVNRVWDNVSADGVARRISWRELMVQ